MGVYSSDDLRGLKPHHDFFIGVDSDGCVFDSMAVKQCEVFHPLIIQYWGLETIEKALRETAEFVNLGSVWRGQNRFRALLKTFELLAERNDVAASGVKLPDIASIRAYVDSDVALGNPTLATAVASDNRPEWNRMLEWSLAVNAAIDARPDPIPPFPGAIDALARISSRTDSIVVSQTPEAALVSEWREHGIEKRVRLIAGQELGTKAEHLRLAAIGKYPSGHCLLIGDAPGDLHAASETGVHFFPIIPGKEVESWHRFNTLILDAFLAGNYGGAIETEEVNAFRAALPSTPPWVEA